MKENFNKEDSVDNYIVTDKKTAKRDKILNIVSIVLALIMAFIGGFYCSKLFTSKNKKVANKIIDIIDKVGYVYDPVTNELRELTSEDYADAIVNGVLDDYAKYYTKEELEAERAESQGNYFNFGFALNKKNNSVRRVVGNSPAFKSGLQMGDKVTHVSLNSGEKIPISKNNDVLEAFKTVETLTEFKLYVTRDGEFIDKEIILSQNHYKVAYADYRDNETRFVFSGEGDESLQLKEIAGSYDFLDDKTSYIKFDLFEGDCVNQLVTLLDKSVERGRTKIILDLRGNGGGYMHLLCDIASHLLYNNGEKNPVVAIAKGKNKNETFRADDNHFMSGIEKMSVIANDGTASASECLIGALLTDNKLLNRERLIIEKNDDGIARTFGKGIMQTTYNFTDGSGIKLTTAKIYWPDNETCIHGTGVIAEGVNATEKGMAAIVRAAECLK